MENIIELDKITIRSNNIIINEMILRDGLQSLTKVYDLKIKKHIYDLIVQTGISNIEFGSTTSEKILPQMANSFELFNLINPINYSDNQNNINQLNLIMLCTNTKLLPKCDDFKIDCISLACSISNDFSFKNFNYDSDKSIGLMLYNLEILLRSNKKFLRVYISGCFGDLTGNHDPDNIKLIGTIEKITSLINRFDYKNNFDIVLSDTYGFISESTLSKTLLDIKKYFNSQDNLITKYLCLHLHLEPGDQFKKIINIGLNHGVIKYDSSIGGIGGCPFSGSKCKGNIDTFHLVKYLTDQGYQTNISLDILNLNSILINKILFE